MFIAYGEVTHTCVTFSLFDMCLRVTTSTDAVPRDAGTKSAGCTHSVYLPHSPVRLTSPHLDPSRDRSSIPSSAHSQIILSDFPRNAGFVLHQVHSIRCIVAYDYNIHQDPPAPHPTFFKCRTNPCESHHDLPTRLRVGLRVRHQKCFMMIGVFFRFGARIASSHLGCCRDPATRCMSKFRRLGPFNTGVGSRASFSISNSGYVSRPTYAVTAVLLAHNNFKSPLLTCSISWLATSDRSPYVTPIINDTEANVKILA